MTLINNKKIDLIRSKVNIVTVISNYLSLKKKGNNYWTICPFHKESNPSMSVSLEKQIFYCFSCLTGGNVFTFLQKYKNINFIEAFKRIAKMTNIKINELIINKEKQKYNEVDYLIFKINELASSYFSNNLETKKANFVKKYLKKRNINNNEIELFKIGYSENSINNLYNFLIKKGYSINNIKEAGLIIINNNKIYDYFNNRIMFPIKNEDNYIIGFSGRIIGNNKNLSKYFNTPETKVFKKKELLYNIEKAKSYIYEKKYLILLEGYMDVISLQKINIKNTVALMGTNFSEYHLKKIKKITNKCFIFLDGDKTGINASLKIAVKLLINNIKVKIVLNKTKKDPDELINNGQIKLVKTMLINSQYPINFVINYFKNKFNLEKINELENFINIIAPIIKVSKNPLEQELAINNLIKLLKISKKTIITKINQFKINKKIIFFNKNKIIKQNNFLKINNKIENKNLNISKINKKNNIIIDNSKYKIKNLKRYILAEQKMLLQLISSRDASDFYQKKIINLNFNNYRLLANNIINYYNKNLEIKNIKIDLFFNEINNENLKKILIEIINKTTIEIKYNKKELEDYALLIDDFANEKEISILWNKLEKTNNIIEQQSISTEIDKLNQRLKFKKG